MQSNGNYATERAAAQQPSRPATALRHKFWVILDHSAGALCCKPGTGDYAFSSEREAVAEARRIAVGSRGRFIVLEAFCVVEQIPPEPTAPLIRMTTLSQPPLPVSGSHVGED
jgi:hypothetical protein